MAQIVLDAEAFKALSSDTRLQILKALDARPLTVSEMGRLLQLNKATVFEHLKQLAGADLVKKIDDEGRKWVYYKLTWKGRNVVHPENVQFMLLLGTAALSVGGLVAQLFNVFRTVSQTSASSDSNAAAPEPNQSQEPAFAPSADEARSGAAQGAPPPSQAASESASPPADDVGPAPDQPAIVAKPSEEPAVWQDPNVWLLFVLGVLLIITVAFVGRYLVERRRERARIAQRLDAVAQGSVASD